MNPTLADLANLHVAIWGHGREGAAALAVLRRRFPGKPLTLFCGGEEAARLGRERGDASLNCITTAPDAAALCAFDAVIKSPGISPYVAPVPQARAAGVRFTSSTALWFAERPDARVIAVTGTKGKSTTSAMIAHLARARGVRTALAGNIGLPLLELIDAQADLWVVELSSFQTGDAGPLEAGLITNLYEEHLDWHLAREQYAADKLRLADVARTLIVNATQRELLERTAAHPRRLRFPDTAGWQVRDGDLCRHGAVIGPSFAASSHLPGAHNAMNACAALTALDALYAFDDAAARAAVRSLAGFRGLPHRLQMLGTRAGRRWIDDSISTTPQATLAALDSLSGAVVAILGGYERGLDWTAFAAAVRSRPGVHFVAQGANGPRIAAALRAGGVAADRIDEAADLAAAVMAARRASAESGTILLSPGAPSFDQFRDYAERGRRFAQLAGFDPASIDEIPGLGIA